jgi:hypothetical protein
VAEVVARIVDLHHWIRKNEDELQAKVVVKGGKKMKITMKITGEEAVE